MAIWDNPRASQLSGEAWTGSQPQRMIQAGAQAQVENIPEP